MVMGDGKTPPTCRLAVLPSCRLRCVRIGHAGVYSHREAVILDARNAGGVSPVHLGCFDPRRPACSVPQRPVDRGRASSGPGLSLIPFGAKALVCLPRDRVAFRREDGAERALARPAMHNIARACRAVCRVSLMMRYVPEVGR